MSTTLYVWGASVQGSGGAANAARAALTATGKILTAGDNAGEIESATASGTTYLCTSAGQHTLTVTASDGSCPVTQNFLVTCVP